MLNSKGNSTADIKAARGKILTIWAQHLILRHFKITNAREFLMNIFGLSSPGEVIQRCEWSKPKL